MSVRGRRYKRERHLVGVLDASGKMVTAGTHVSESHRYILSKLPLDRKIPLHVVSAGRIRLHKRLALGAHLNQVKPTQRERQRGRRADCPLEKDRKSVHPVL